MRPAIAARAIRATAGAGLGWFVVSALSSSALPMPARVAAVAVIILTAWQPLAGLIVTVALAPAGALLAPPPARTAELLVWALLTVWLLALWRPLTPPRLNNPPLTAAALYAACALASWIAYTVGGAAGTEAQLVPMVIARAVPIDHLVFSSPEPETFTLLPALTGIALFAAAASIVRAAPQSRMAIAAVIAASAAGLSLITIAAVVQMWAGVDYGAWFLLRYVRGVRFSLHLSDLNAAGSLYVLGLLTACGLAVADRARRAIWVALAILIVPALWISGSRSAAVGGLLAGGSLIPLLRGRKRPQLRPAYVLAAAVVVAVAAIGAAIMASGPAEQGTAAHALRLRWQFMVTSTRMFASAPVFGVGVGHYHERSNEFMPLALQTLYGYENAHNYFAQQFAELGLVGGVLFIWLVASVLRAGWRHVESTSDAAALALLAGVAGYVLTCVTGHPLLVPEAAMPFWAALGALAATAESPPHEPRRRATRWIAVLVTAMAMANVALAARRYALTRTPPGERGFYTLENDTDGRQFVWMTRHGIFYAGPQPGTVSIPVRAPDFLEGTERFSVSVDVAGRRAGVYEAVPDRWTTIEIPIRRPSALPFRRIDLRVNRSWSPMRDRGESADDQPRSVMVAETRWTPAGGR